MRRALRSGGFGCSWVALVAAFVLAPSARGEEPGPGSALLPGGPRLRASIINVFPQGKTSVIIINRGSQAGVSTTDWVRHARGVCRPIEVYGPRSKCVMPVSDRDLGALREVQIWSDADVTPAMKAAWTRPQPPEPEAPAEPRRWVRAPAPRLVVYRRFEDLRMTHACLGFTPDGASAFVLTGGTRYPGDVESPLVLTRFSIDGAVSEIPIAEPGVSADVATSALDAIRQGEKLLACHEAKQERLPADAPAEKASTSWPVLASHDATSRVYLWVDASHLNAASAASPSSVREVLSVVLDGADGDKTRPERLGTVYYLPGAELHVIELHGWRGSRRIGVRVAPR